MSARDRKLEIALWTPDELELQDRLIRGETIVVNIRANGPHPRLVEWAEREGLLVYIGRSTRGRPCSPWANPYKVGRDGTRGDVVDRFAALRDLKPPGREPRNLAELEGKALGCWCKPERCHGDIIAASVNAHRIG